MLSSSDPRHLKFYLVYSDIYLVFYQFYPTYILTFYLTFVPTELWRSRLRSGSAHWDLEITVDLEEENEEKEKEGGMHLW